MSFVNADPLPRVPPLRLSSPAPPESLASTRPPLPTIDNARKVSPSPSYNPSKVPETVLAMLSVGVPNVKEIMDGLVKIIKG